MAIGNIGNLLQHFVALRAAERVVAAWNRPNDPIEYIDCYSMAPWEPITGNQPQGFVSRINSFPEKVQNNDFVASVFRQAWAAKYPADQLPERPQDREYPNTAALLRAAFPTQMWRMRLHEDDSTQPGKRRLLEDWARCQNNGEFLVEGDWQTSRLICRSPVPTDRPVIVMLDPFRIVGDNDEGGERAGYLRTGLLRFLLGCLALNISGQNEDRTVPMVVCLFSYSDRLPNVDVPNGIVAAQFQGNWNVERVQSGPWQGHAGPTFHQAWIASTGIDTPVIGENAQSAWENWNQ